MKKTILRIPGKEQYSYVEVEFDIELSPEECAAELARYTKAMTGGAGLDMRDFNRVLDRYLWGDGKMTPDEYEGMNLDQQGIIQTIKRSRARNK